MLGLQALGIEWATYLMIASILLLLVTGQPLAFVTGLVAMFFAFGWFGPLAFPLVTSRVYSFLNEYVLVAVPMFVLMASILDRSGIARDLYNTMRLFAGRLPGGVAIQTLVVALFLAAMSGIIGGEIVLLALLTMPIFVPIVIKLGFSPIWFGTLFSMNMQVSYISPPFGPAAFYLKSVAPPSITLGTIFKSLWPFILLQLVALGLVLTFPQLALWLPGL